MSQLPNGILMGSAAFAQYINLTNMQTDTQTTLCVTSFAIGLFLFIYLSVHSHISRTACPDFTNFSAHVTCGHGSVLL